LGICPSADDREAVEPRPTRIGSPYFDLMNRLVRSSLATGGIFP
jgi:hypothetical protein